jgi:hypothetical protein
MTEIKEEDEDDGLPQRLSLHSLVGHSSRRNEKKVNANRVTILKKLQENNEKYIEFLETHTKDGHDEPQKCIFFSFFTLFFLFFVFFFSS